MRRLALGFGTAALIAAAPLGGPIGPATAVAGDIAILAGGFSLRAPVDSMREQRFGQVVRQQYDFSCGSASLATLLTYHYDHPMDEQSIFLAMWENGDRERIETSGFSLLDMKEHLARLGYQSEGYEVDLDRLAEVGIPAIVLINLRGYMHFVVIKGVTEDRVLVGDPAIGMNAYDRAEFEAMWNGIVFVITDRLEIAQASFNRADEWRLRPTAPLGTALTRESLSLVALTLPGPTDF
jgi:predicted double-glycine peptidase